INLSGFGSTSYGRSFLFRPPEERCLRRAFPGETVGTISRSRPATCPRVARRGGQGWRSHRTAARSVLDGPEHGASLAAGRDGTPVLAGGLGWFANRSARAVISTQATPAMEDRQTPVRILMHLHRRFHEVRTQRAFGDLHFAILIRYAIVVPHNTVFLDAQSLDEVQTSRDHECTALLLGLRREPRVMHRYISVAQPGVGCFNCRDPGQRQFLRHAPLQGPEQTFRPAARLGRIRRDMLDTQLRQRTPNLRRLLAIYLAASFRCVKVMTSPLG